MAGIRDKVAGKVKELEGKLTGDRVREVQGVGQRRRGEVKAAAEGVKDRVTGAAREAKGKITGKRSEEAAGRARRTKGRLES